MGLPVFRMVLVAKKGKVKTETYYSHLEATSKRILKMREVDKVSTDLDIASWESLMREFQRMKLCWQILNPWVKVMQSGYSVYKLCLCQINGSKPYGDGENLYIFTNNVKL